MSSKFLFSLENREDNAGSIYQREICLHIQCANYLHIAKARRILATSPNASELRQNADSSTQHANNKCIERISAAIPEVQMLGRIQPFLMLFAASAAVEKAICRL